MVLPVIQSYIFAPNSPFKQLALESQSSPSDLVSSTRPEERCDWLDEVYTLPAQYVPRVGLLQEVKELLLGTAKDVAFTSGLQAKALHGMGWNW